jgi:hypothetical protein
MIRTAVAWPAERHFNSLSQSIVAKQGSENKLFNY